MSMLQNGQRIYAHALICESVSTEQTKAYKTHRLCGRIVLTGPNKEDPDLVDIAVVGEDIKYFALDPRKAVMVMLHRLQKKSTAEEA